LNLADAEVAVRCELLDFSNDPLWDRRASEIQAGQVMPSMLLRKLGSYSRKSLLYLGSFWHSNPGRTLA